jgi:hypothetical protein
MHKLTLSLSQGDYVRLWCPELAKVGELTVYVHKFVFVLHLCSQYPSESNKNSWVALELYVNEGKQHV